MLLLLSKLGSIVDASTGGIEAVLLHQKQLEIYPLMICLSVWNRNGVDLNQIVENSEWLESELGAVPAMVPKAEFSQKTLNNM